MRKKIGDLTLRETKIICKKYRRCENCPLFPKDEFFCLLNSVWFEEKYLDQEIEVKEDEQRIRSVKRIKALERNK
ncbi:MAG: hypothetical protein J6T10_04785 [Methanobrevibacter sp.]|nr:hypothetical protein [Methanobrevibacter sp.]